eukprot:109680_1
MNGWQANCPNKRNKQIIFFPMNTTNNATPNSIFRMFKYSERLSVHSNRQMPWNMTNIAVDKLCWDSTVQKCSVLNGWFWYWHHNSQNGDSFRLVEWISHK